MADEVRHANRELTERERSNRDSTIRGTTNRESTQGDALSLDAKRRALIEAMSAEPYRYDFFQALRRLEALSPGQPRLGEARRPSAEPLRLAQEASLSFAPSNLSAVQTTLAGLPRVFVRFLGMFGPQGALPTHLTEFARDRERNFGDATFARFVDTFHHRQLLLFYRAWRQAQPTANRDRPTEDRFATYVGALFGHGSPAWRNDASGIDEARRFHAGHLSRNVRHADGLAAILANDLGVPATIRSFVARWMPLPVSERTSLGASKPANAMLGRTAVVGSRVLDVQNNADIVLGPLDYPAYQRLLPGGLWHRRVRQWVREYLSDELDVRLVPALEARSVPAPRLGADGRLGLNIWIGGRESDAPAMDLSLPVSRPVVA